MKPIHFLPFLSLLLLLAPSSGNAAGSMLRIACNGSNKGAEVEINGKFKGECPLDLQVPEGKVNLKVWQAVDDLEERVYEEKMRIGDGVVKKVDVVLGPSQLSQKGNQYLDKYYAAKLHEDEQLANSGDVKAMMEMAKHYRFGYHGILQRSEEKMVLLMRKAADGGHPEAMRWLSVFYAEGKPGFLKSKEQSLTWRIRAAEAGDQLAISELAYGYSFGGYGLHEDAAQGKIWDRKGFEVNLKNSRAGDPQSMANVGRNYIDGIGVEENRTEGLKWLQQSAATYRTLADAGDWCAMSSLSLATIDEKGEKMSPEQKEYWSKLAKARTAWFYDFKGLREFVRRTEGAAR